MYVAGGSPCVLKVERCAEICHLGVPNTTEGCGIEFCLVASIAQMSSRPATLASLLAAANDAPRANDAYVRLAAVDPFDAHALAATGRFALQRKDAPTAVPAFRSALATNPVDRAAAHLDLSEAYVRGNQLTDARREVLAALEIEPGFQRAQDLLLTIRERGTAAPANR
jgi:tetratricopeptide (TPR) repeat protein